LTDFGYNEVIICFLKYDLNHKMVQRGTAGELFELQIKVLRIVN